MRAAPEGIVDSIRAFVGLFCKLREIRIYIYIYMAG